MSEIDYRPQQSNILYWRNVANEGRGSQMTQCLHEACDYAAKLEAENAEMADELRHICDLLDSAFEQGISIPGLATTNKARALLDKVEGK